VTPPLRPRVLFVNSGILGHRAVAELMRDAAARIPGVDAAHINLSEGLTLRDRFVRRILCARVMPNGGPAANLDLARWRQELNAGLLAARRISIAERRGPFDVLHLHTQATAYASLRRMEHTPAIVSIDATQRQAGVEATSPLARATYGANIAHDGRVFRAAHAVTATSRWAAKDFTELYPDCAHKLRVMPYPVRAHAFDREWLAARVSRAGNGHRSPVRVLFIGGDFPRKGGPLLLDAWRDASCADRAELDLVTDWPLDEARLPPAVRLIRGIGPYSPAWIELWRRADLFVMPSRHEAFGMVLQEAAAAALPSIATAINAIPELVEHGATGLLVSPDNRSDLVRALRTLVDAPALRFRMGAAARERVLTTASPEAYAAELSAIIEHLLKRHEQNA
jgi:alpha-maltose-1-phosphate synthase